MKSKHEKLFNNVIPNSIEGIEIFTASDEFIKPQKSDDVTYLENRIWSELFQKLSIK